MPIQPYLFYNGRCDEAMRFGMLTDRFGVMWMIYVMP